MINAWRNWFVDPETGLPWATVMMFPWLKYGINPTQPPKRSLKIPVQNAEKVVQAVAKKEKSPTAKTAAIKQETPDKKLPIKAPKFDLVKVEKTTAQTVAVPAKKAAKTTEKVAKKATEKVKTAEKVAEKVAQKATEKVKITAKTEPVASKEKKKAINTETQSKESSAPASKTPAKETTPPVTNKESTPTTPISLLDTVPSNTKTTKVSTKRSGANSKKVEFSAEEVVSVSMVKRFTPIDTEKMPVKVQNLITQTNPSSPKAQIREAVILLCSDQWAEKEALADKLKFTAGQLETLHLTPMVNSGQLLLRYPQDLTHPEQAYRAVSEKKSK